MVTLGKNRKASLIIERPIKTYWGLNHASYVLLEKSKGNDEPLENGIIPGNYYTTMASLIFSAFTLEAYFNHLGSEKINFWKEIEFISVENKLRIFEREFSLDINYGKRPYQTFRDLFKGYEWNRISRSDRLLLGTLFLNYIKTADIRVVPIEKTSSGQQRYVYR